jgi:hypothetical protein
MTIICEDGTGLATAETFITVAEADVRMAARGFALWATMSDSEKEQALRRATDYMEQVYRLRWAGYRLKSTQSLSWPRDIVPMKDAPGYTTTYYPSDSVPAIVKNACCELAYKAAHGELATDIERMESSVKVGPITTTYSDAASPYVKYRAIDNMLMPFFANSGGNISLVRS